MAPECAKHAARQILGIAHGVRVLHSMSPPIIHGNIMGQHVLIDTRGRPLLSEFRLTKVCTHSRAAVSSAWRSLGAHAAPDGRGFVEARRDYHTEQRHTRRLSVHGLGAHHGQHVHDVRVGYLALAMTALQVRASVLRVDPCLMYLRQLLTGDRPFAEVTANSLVVIEVREPGRMFIPARLKRALAVL
jgi:hypothetical protein